MASAEAVAKIRRLMEAASTSKHAQDTAEAIARRGYAEFEYNTALPTLDTSRRAKALRGVARVMARYAWAGPEVTRVLDAHDVARADELGDDQVLALADRLQHLAECAQEGFDAPDAPVAR